MPSNVFRRRCATARRAAYSLVELVAATALMASTLVPALELVRDGMELSEEADRRQLLALYATSQIEQTLCSVADSWSLGTTTGDYSADGHASIRYTTSTSDDPLDGGVTSLLMDVRTTVYFDEDGDDTFDADELNCSFRTKIGKFATYEALTP